MARVTLEPGWTTPEGKHMAGLRIEMEPGWKTYWRAPQGNGIPPQFDWTGSENLHSVRVYWPQPEVFEIFGSRSVGYGDTVLFPLEITPSEVEAPVDLTLDLFFGLCDEVCIPAEAQVSLSLPGEGGAAESIRASFDSRTVHGSDAGLSAQTCTVSEDGTALTVSARMAAPLEHPDMVVFETGSELLWINPVDTFMSDGVLSILSDVMWYGEGTPEFSPRDVRITLLGSGRAIELPGC